MFESIKQFISDNITQANKDATIDFRTNYEYIGEKSNPFKIGGIEFKRNKINLNDTHSDLKIKPDEGILNYGAKFKIKPIVYSKDMNIVDTNNNTLPNNSLRFLGDLELKNIFDITGGLPTDRNHPTNHALKIALVTTSDFFYDNLVELSYNLNTNNYVFGTITDNIDINCLLPLKPLYFSFFNAKNIKDRLTITKTSSNIEYKLKIPLENDKFAILTKKYTISSTSDKLNFSFTFFPLLKYFRYINGKLEPDYNFYNAFYKSEKDSCKCLFFKQNEIESENIFNIEYQNTRANNNVLSAKRQTEQAFGLTNHIRINKEFDFIVLNNNNNYGVLIPNFDEKIEPNDTDRYFEAAIDFGTTNTHVEISSQNFKINDASKLHAFLVKDNKLEDFASNLNMIYDNEYIPQFLNDTAPNAAKFPTNTLLFKSTYTGITDDTMLPFLFSNIGFNTDSNFKNIPNTENIKLITELKPKFEKDPTNENKPLVSNLLEEIIIILRAILIKEGFSLSKFKLVWTFPSTTSDEQYKRNIETLIKNITDKHFITPFVIPYSESLAPFKYIQREIDSNPTLKTTIGLNGTFINIDIGGGTTDIAIGTLNEITVITSLKFAGTDIWKGFEGENDTTFQKENESKFLAKWEQLKENDFNQHTNDAFKKYATSVKDATHINSLNKINYLFKFEELKFSELFEGTNQKLKFPLYYHLCVILYHVAELVHKHNITTISQITFSGLGSKYINFILNNTELKSFVQGFFNGYKDIKNANGEQISNVNIKNVLLQSNSKEITAKGALLFIKDINPNNNDFTAILERNKKDPEILFTVDRIFPNTRKKYDPSNPSQAASTSSTSINKNKLFDEIYKSILELDNIIYYTEVSDKIAAGLNLTHKDFQETFYENIGLIIGNEKNKIPFENSFEKFDINNKTMNALVFAFKDVINNLIS